MSKEKEAECDKPPPYQEVEDEFGQRGYSSTEKKVEDLSSVSVFPSAPNLTFDEGKNVAGNSSGNGECQKDFFQKPPKFLLHSLKQDGTSSEFVVTSKTGSSDQPQGAVPILQNNSTVFTVPQVEGSVPARFPNANVPTPQRSLMFDEHMPRYTQRILCPYCRTGVNTRVEYVNGTMTHLAAIGACWFTCCFCIPYFIRELKDVEHYCPDCGKILGCNRKMEC